MRTLSCLLLLTGVLLGQAAEAPVQKQQQLWQKLQVEIAQTDRELDGVMGVALTDLTSGQQLLHNAD